MDKILTISIAAYNMEKYIRMTLDSLIIMELLDDLEVFIIDDGGIDNTLTIAQEYSQKYPNTFYPIHKDNAGYGSTVNYSISKARGKFFKCLDGDDWFDKQGLYKLINELKRVNADIIVNSLYKGSDAKHLEIIDKYCGKLNGLYNIAEIEDNMCSLGMWNLCYKTELLRNSGLNLPNHMLYTDQIFSTLPFTIANTILYLDFPVYCYRIGRTGQSVEWNSRIKHTQEALHVCKYLCECFELRKYTGNNMKYIRKRIADYNGNFAIKSLLLHQPSTDVLSRLKKYEKDIYSISPQIYYETELIGLFGRFICIMRKTNYKIYWIFKLVPIWIIKWISRIAK